MVYGLEFMVFRFSVKGLRFWVLRFRVDGIGFQGLGRQDLGFMV